MTSTHGMDPMSMPGMMAPMMAGSHGPGSAGAGMGAALMATPQQQPLPGPQFMPPTSFGMEPEMAQVQGFGGPLAAPVSNAQQGAQPNPLRPVEPKFQISDINTSNLNGIVPHITVDSRLTLLKDQPDLVQLIKIAIEKSIQEWAAPVIERANKIALTTTEQIVKKDYSLDHDENRMRSSAHSMVSFFLLRNRPYAVQFTAKRPKSNCDNFFNIPLFFQVRNLTSGMAMITCRDHLLQSIKNHLKHFMVTLGRNLTQQQTEAIETTVRVIANDNVELACAFIQKKAIEKAIVEVDKRLKPEFESRLGKNIFFVEFYRLLSLSD